MSTWDKQVQTFEQVDFRLMKMPVIAVFYNTSDYKGKYIARLFDIENPMNIIVLKNTLEEIRAAIPKQFIRTSRLEEDHETVVEVWL